MSSIRLNTLFVSIGQGLRIAMAMLLLPVASRILGPASFGRYNLATTIMFFTMLADDLGLNMWVTREIAKHKERAQRYFAYAVGLKVVLIPLSLLFVALYLELGSYDRETVEAVWIFSLYALLTSFRDLAVALFRAFEEMEWESLAQSIEKVLTTALGIAVLLTGGGLKGLPGSLSPRPPRVRFIPSAPCFADSSARPWPSASGNSCPCCAVQWSLASRSFSPPSIRASIW